MIDDEDIYYDAFYFTPAYIFWKENQSYESVSQDIASGKIPVFIAPNGETYIAPEYFNR